MEDKAGRRQAKHKSVARNEHLINHHPRSRRNVEALYARHGTVQHSRAMHTPPADAVVQTGINK